MVPESAAPLSDHANTPGATRLFLAIFLCSIVAIVATIAALDHISATDGLNRVVVREESVVQAQRRAVDALMETVIRDINFLDRTNELDQYLTERTDQSRAMLAKEFAAFCKSMALYDQVRLLNTRGWELVRINNHDSNPVIVRIARLQNKSDRYYFTRAIDLDDSQYYISPMDLNVEKGRVELPHKAMIRVAKPVRDDRGRVRGVLVLNYLAQHILDRVSEIGEGGIGHPLLLNSDGFWLMADQPGRAWGFMYPKRKSDNFAQQYPDVWRTMLEHETGSVFGRDGLYVYTTIHPTRQADARHAMTEKSYFWKVVSFVPSPTLARHTNQSLGRLLGLGMGLLLSAALASWQIAAAVTKRRHFQKRLMAMAHFDNMTGLPNRALFFDRLRQVHATCVRNKRKYALIYLDLDGFKDVNDAFGHKAGDELLVAVAKRLQESARRSDTVARLGGDEFAVILPEVKSADDALAVGRKFLAQLSEPIQLDCCQAEVGASLGIGLFPDQGTDPESLLKLADLAMYESKAKGKNTITLADSV